MVVGNLETRNMDKVVVVTGGCRNTGLEIVVDSPASAR